MKVILCVFGMVLAAVCALAEETYSSVDTGSDGKRGETFPPGLIKFTDGDLAQVLDVYQELSGRTVVRATTLPATKITIRSQTQLTRIEALQALDTVLAQNGIVMIPQGTKHVKAVARAAAAQECPPILDVPREQLPDCGTYITYFVTLKHKKPIDVAAAIQPFAALPNSILAVDSANLIVLRDLSSNVRRMAEVLERVDKESPPDEPEKSKSATGKRKKLKAP